MRYWGLWILVSAATSLSLQKRGSCASKIAQTWNFTKEGDSCYEGSLVGKTLNKKYLIQYAVGRGKQAIVFVASYNGQKYAVKCFKGIREKSRLDAVNEIAMLNRVKNPNVIEKIDSFEELNHLFLVTEYCETDLLNVLRSPPLYNGNKLYIQILDAVIYLHGQGIFHRDLKLENILIKSLSDPVVKIADFGLASDEILTSNRFVGSPLTAAPEVMAQIKGYPWAKCDIYSLGVILFNMHTRSFPWGRSSINATIEENLDQYLAQFKVTFHLKDSLISIFRRVFGKSEFRPAAVEFKTLYLRDAILPNVDIGPKCVS